MTLNDQLYARLVNLYQGLDDEKIHQLNARLILLLLEEISDSLVIKKIIDQFSFNFIESISAVGELFILTFVFFRFFDISKIGPVGWIENNRLEKAYIRVVGDDIMAAILSIIVVIFLLNVNLYVMQ